ncbi:hypothetical protein NL676_008865 [Syzygium grande]|nr:hypothetical protein NL676_008865 [Syzygium grande]
MRRQQKSPDRPADKIEKKHPELGTITASSGDLQHRNRAEQHLECQCRGQISQQEQHHRRGGPGEAVVGIASRRLGQ